MRVAAAGLVAIIAAIALALNASARADDASPFPSPSPEATQTPGSGGYALIGVAALSASGGQFMPSGSSPTPVPFLATHASGYAVEVLGRLSTSYLALLHYQDVNIHGDDFAVTSRFDVTALYQFPKTGFGAGIGYVSTQRSTATLSANGFGFGLALLPDFTRRVSPYAAFNYFPSLSATGGTRAGLTALRLGVTIAPPRATGLFARVGLSVQNFGASTFSPQSLSGPEIGVGTTF